MNDIVVPPTGTFTKCCIVCNSEWWVEWDIYVPHGWIVIWIVHPKLSPVVFYSLSCSFKLWFTFFLLWNTNWGTLTPLSSTERKYMETKGWQALKRTTTNKNHHTCISYNLHSILLLKSYRFLWGEGGNLLEILLEICGHHSLSPRLFHIIAILICFLLILSYLNFECIIFIFFVFILNLSVSISLTVVFPF